MDGNLPIRFSCCGCCPPQFYQESVVFSVSKGADVAWRTDSHPLLLWVHVTNAKVVSLQQVVVVAHVVQQELSFGFSLQRHKTQIGWPINQYQFFIPCSGKRRIEIKISSFQRQLGQKGSEATTICTVTTKQQQSQFGTQQQHDSGTRETSKQWQVSPVKQFKKQAHCQIELVSSSLKMDLNSPQSDQIRASDPSGSFLF